MSEKRITVQDILGGGYTNFRYVLSQDAIKGIAARAILSIEDPEKGVGTELFEASLKVFPQVAIETVIVDDIQSPGPAQILLTWREDEHYKGWHVAGGFMRFGKSFEQTIADILRREHEAKVEDVKETGITYNRVDSRGQTIGIVFLVKSDVPTDQNTSQKKWFNHIPQDALPHHKDFLRRVLGWR